LNCGIYFIGRYAKNPIDGKRYRWADLLRLRREQRAATPQAQQLALFDALPADRRPAGERTASDRYRQPSLFTRLDHS
jgi:hypothetical protein